MNSLHRKAESLFDRFRRAGDPVPLAEVFDLVADDLFVVALHLRAPGGIGRLPASTSGKRRRSA